MAPVNATYAAGADHVAGSALNYLPQGPVTDFFMRMNDVMSSALVQYIPDTPLTHLFIVNPLLFLIIFFIVAVAAAIFLDFLVDAWKMPFAIAVDILDIIAISLYPWLLDAVAAAAAFLIFFLLASDTGKTRFWFGGIGAVKCLLPIPMVQILPINTALMLISTVIDKGL